MSLSFAIEEAQEKDYPQIGELLVAVYSSLSGMPSIMEQPDYYTRLRDAAGRAGNPLIHILIARDRSGQLLGSVDFIEDMKHYASGGKASTMIDAAGIRLLAINPHYQGQGIGKALTLDCIQRARLLGRSKVFLHTTRAMIPAWKMYEKMGFTRFPDIDFMQGQLEVFGFKLDIGTIRRTD